MEREAGFGIATTVVPTARGSLFERMIVRARERGVRAFLFHPENSGLQTGDFVGRTLIEGRPGSAWVKMSFGRPDVIYENVYVHLVAGGLTRSLRRYAARNRIPLFNPVIVGKAGMSRMTSVLAQSGMRSPSTRRVEGERTIRDMLDAYGAVYVKPAGGHGGNGVMRVRRRHGVHIVDCDRWGGGKGFRRELSGRAWEHFVQRTVMARPHIVQQPIPLLTYDGGQVDFRVVVQRGSGGSWRLIGIVPKIAQNDGVVTNIVAGGRRVTMQEMEGRLGVLRETGASRNLEKSAIAFSRRLSERYPLLAILGYDLGVDRHGNIWFIETNPKPARSLLFPEMRRRATDLAVDFACYIVEKRQGVLHAAGRRVRHVNRIAVASADGADTGELRLLRPVRHASFPQLMLRTPMG